MENATDGQHTGIFFSVPEKGGRSLPGSWTAARRGRRAAYAAQKPPGLPAECANSTQCGTLLYSRDGTCDTSKVSKRNEFSSLSLKEGLAKEAKLRKLTSAQRKETKPAIPEIQGPTLDGCTNVSSVAKSVSKYRWIRARQEREMNMQLCVWPLFLSAPKVSGPRLR